MEINDYTRSYLQFQLLKQFTIAKRHKYVLSCKGEFILNKFK